MGTGISYELKLLNDPQTPTKQLGQAVALYTRYTPVHLKTASNEIAYWAMRYNKVYHNKLFLYGLVSGDRIVGFCQLVAFRDQRLLAVDQLVIHPHWRNITAFSAFVDLIRNDLDARLVDYNFAVVEVPLEQGGLEPYENERLMIRLLKLHGFGVVKQPYEMPNLDIANYEAAGKAHLLLFVKGGAKRITAQTYMTILTTIFYEHYLKWYQMPDHQRGLSIYKNNLDKLFKKLSSAVEKKQTIEINGYNVRLAEPLGHSSNELSWFLRFTIPAAGTLILLSALLLMAKSFFSVSTSELAQMLGLSLLTLLIFQAIRTTKIEKIISVAIRFFGKAE